MITSGHETCHHKIYGLTCLQFEELLRRASGRCERCSIPAEAVYRGKLVIDHEGRIAWEAVRGLLCQKCNAHMRRVDRGERPVDKLTFGYLDLSGVFVPPGFPHWKRFDGSGVEARAAILDAIRTAERGARDALRAKPQLACAPRAATAPW